MIDLTSTSTNDAQTARCAHLLAAVVARIVMDACTPPTKAEQQDGINRDADACESLRIMLSRRSTFHAYCGLIGINGDALVSALMSDRPLLDTPVRGKMRFTERHRKAFQWRSRMWRHEYREEIT